MAGTQKNSGNTQEEPRHELNCQASSLRTQHPTGHHAEAGEGADSTRQEKRNPNMYLQGKDSHNAHTPKGIL